MSSAKNFFSVLKRKKTHTLQNLAGIFGWNDSFFRGARGARILVYHGVCRTRPTRFNSLFITAKTFESHLRFYKKYFAVISMDDFYQKRFISGRFNICLTFDDGFANNHDYVLPLLRKYQLPAHFFVTAIRDAGESILWNDFLCQQQHFGPAAFSLGQQTYRRNRQLKYVDESRGTLLSEDLRRTDYPSKARMMQTLSAYYRPDKRIALADFWMQLTETQLRAMADAPGISIGGHGYFHNDLAMLAPAALSSELRQSKAWLEKITGKPVESMAFPYGSYSPAVVTAARSAGYRQLLAVDFNLAEDAREHDLRERFTVNPYISVNNQMIAVIKKKYA